MAVVKIIKKTYNNENTGEILPYERLALIGTVGGEIHTLEIKLTKSEILAAKMILGSNEKSEVTARSTTPDESDAFFKQNAGRSDDNKFNLNEE